MFHDCCLADLNTGDPLPSCVNILSLANDEVPQQVNIFCVTPPPCLPTYRSPTLPPHHQLSLTLNLLGFASTNSCTCLQHNMPNLLYVHHVPTTSSV